MDARRAELRRVAAGGEIGWQGINSRILSSKRPVMAEKGVQKRTLGPPGVNPFGTRR